MAGGFGGDDEDFENYDLDDEELDEDEEDYDDEEDEEDDEEENDDEEKPETPEDEKRINKKKQFEAEEAKLQKSLPEIQGKLDMRYFPYMTSKEKGDLDKARKHPKLLTEMGKTYKKFYQKIIEFIRNHITVIFWIVVILLAVFVGLPIIITVITWPIKWLLWPEDEESGGGSSGGGAAFGVTGDDFYGVRTLYTDDEKARIGLLEEYSTIIDNSIEQTLTVEKLKTITENVEGTDVTTTYKVSVVVDLEIPKAEVEGEEPTDFDYSTFEEESFKTTYAEYYLILNSVAEKVYVKDNPSGAVPQTLVEKLDGIKYFGLDLEISEEVKNVIYNKLIELYDVEVYNQTNNALETDTTKINTLKTEFKDAIELDIESKVAEVLSVYTTRTEKLFVKDFILSKDTDMMDGILEENYVCWIFMPKKDVTFEQVSFYVKHSNINNFSIKLFNGGSEISMKKDDADFGDENVSLYSYFAKNLSEEVAQYQDIDTNNLQALSEGVSLLEIVNNQNLETEKYLSLNPDGVYSFIKNGMYVEFSSLEKFYCVEIDTLWSARSN